MRGGLGPWAILSLVGYLAFLGATYDWFDPDEFANLQQAVQSDDDDPLYVDTPSNHPPIYVELLLTPVTWLPVPDLFAARILNCLLIWSSGLLVADLVRRGLGLPAAALFMTLWTVNGYALAVGTRAMNEGPLTFLLALSAWLALGPKPTWMAGGAAGLGLLVRYTAAFYVPALVPRRARAAALTGVTAAAAALLALLAYSLASPGAWEDMLRWTLQFHARRPEEELARRITKTLWWSGVLFVAPLGIRMGLHRRPMHDAAWMGGVAVAGSLFMVLLPATHVHYFLPTTLVVTAVATTALHRTYDRGRRNGLAAAFLLVTASQGALYVPQTPHGSLAEADRAAAIIAEATPPHLPILTDAPQYALLAGRDNWHGYYWSLQDSIPPDELASALNETSLVAVSERFGQYDDGFPHAFLRRLQSLPCRELEGVRIHWTGVAGAAPAGFVEAC